MNKPISKAMTVFWIIFVATVIVVTAMTIRNTRQIEINQKLLIKLAHPEIETKADELVENFKILLEALTNGEE